MRDEAASQFSTVLKIEAVRLLNVTLSNPVGTNELEIAASILMLTRGVMVSSCLFLFLSRRGSAPNLNSQPPRLFIPAYYPFRKSGTDSLEFSILHTLQLYLRQ